MAATRSLGLWLPLGRGPRPRREGVGVGSDSQAQPPTQEQLSHDRGSPPDAGPRPAKSTPRALALESTQTPGPLPSWLW